MMAAASTCIQDGSLLVNGKTLLTGVPFNVKVSPVESSAAFFFGATSSIPSSRHVFSLGVLQEFQFLCLFRYKIWWMIPRVGKLACEIPMETQMLLLEVKEKSALCDGDSLPLSTEKTFYVLLLPVLEGSFRATLQGERSNELQICVESGDANVQTTNVSEVVFMNSGDNPFKLIKDSIKILENHMGTFKHIDNKKVPGHLDWFGWCTWDAFYTDVNPQGIKEGLERFMEGGCPPRFLIIDDGWQETYNDFQKEGEPFVEGSQFASRLTDIKENGKFRGLKQDIPCCDLQEFTNFIKESYGLKFVYVWHALLGYWGGLHPSSETMRKYNPKIEYPIQSPGNTGNLRDIAMDSLEKFGVGVINPQRIFDFYNDLHSYLASCGVDGVKVDVQTLLETLGFGHGGRVALTGRYQEALEESIARNFGADNLICCMNHNSDSFYSSKRSAVARASEDFMPRDPTCQTLHIASVAFNSLLMGEIVVPDWDMFQSKHITAKFHGAARALSGSTVYVSDEPGHHDFELLKKLVLPDGSILRARCSGRPTRDCLFIDPVMDGKNFLKIWNLNKLSGVIGAFNCQGAGNWPLKEGSENILASTSKPLTITGHISPLDIDYIGDIAGDDWTGDCAIYAFNSGSLSRLPKEGKIQVSLSTLECEVFTISPVKVYNSHHFAPIGLIDMYNSGGAIEGLLCSQLPSGCKIQIKTRGCGRFGAYSSSKPSYCTVKGEETKFNYNTEDGLLIIHLEGDCDAREIDVVY
ncbi:probable galactinol--sucrose galactosyltransferase 2 [Solanum stenotomum]|uniref:probable galactinol--sucrose galactosyltransferase 2 n=1 Tax=Solanum stenotomum TaxID=172797 RepID=UPI0020D1D021|nr:probable galactinol--sucrose galactosyltransferase 2 [Solanum stenotomum]